MDMRLSFFESTSMVETTVGDILFEISQFEKCLNFQKLVPASGNDVKTTEDKNHEDETDTTSSGRKAQENCHREEGEQEQQQQETSRCQEEEDWLCRRVSNHWVPNGSPSTKRILRDTSPCCEKKRNAIKQACSLQRVHQEIQWAKSQNQLETTIDVETKQRHFVAQKPIAYAIDIQQHTTISCIFSNMKCVCNTIERFPFAALCFRLIRCSK